MPLTNSSVAAAVGSAAQNTVFTVTANVLQRKIMLIGQYDYATKTTVVDNQLQRVLSKEDAVDRFGAGFMLSKMAEYCFLAGNNEVYCLPVPDPSGAAAVGDLTFSGVSTAAGTLHLYVAGEYVPVSVPTGTVADAVAALVAAAITALPNLPVTASATLAVVTITAKDDGVWGDNIKLSFNELAGETDVPGTSVVVTQPTGGGAGSLDVGASLDAALGTGDSANDVHITDVAHGFSQSASVLDDLSTYNGIGNDFVGLYAKTVSRAFRAMDGNTEAGGTGLTNLIAFGDGRKQDRTNGIIAVPGSASHPSYIASVGIGVMARISGQRAEENFANKPLPGILCGANADRWTSDFDSRNSAVLAGVSPTLCKGGSVLLQNVASFYHPDSIPVVNNGWRSMRTIAIIQNILDAIRTAWESEQWQGVSIVADLAKVSNSVDKAKARDLNGARNTTLSLVTAFEGNAWIFSAEFTVSRLQSDPTLIQLRPGGTGFNITIPVKISGEGLIFDNVVLFDADISV
jgi:phage tail sheath gpL-like